MRILCINPWITDMKLYDEWMHPVGLYMVMALLEKNGHKVDYINLLSSFHEKRKRFSTASFCSTEIHKPDIYRNIDRSYKRFGISESEFFQRLSEVEKPDRIFVTTGMTYWIDGLKQTVEILKTVFPGTLISVGGISATLMHDLMKGLFPNCRIVSGAISAAKLEEMGIYCSEELSINDTYIKELSHLDEVYHAPILTSTGCPLKCTYCASKVLQPYFHRRSHSLILEEVRFATENFNVKNFSFYDDALLHKSKEHFEPLLELLLDNFSDLNFHTPNGMHLRWINPKNAQLMKLANFKTLRFGFESGNSKYNSDINSKLEYSMLEKQISVLRNAGFEGKDIGIYLMGGLPLQTPEMMIEEIYKVSEFGVKVKPVFLSPIPRTKIFDYYMDIVPEISEEPLYHNDLFFVTKLNKWTNEVLDDIKKIVLDVNNAKFLSRR